MNKTFLIMLLTATTILSSSALAYEGTVKTSDSCGNDCTYTIYTDGHMEITGSGDMQSYEGNAAWSSTAPWKSENVTSVTISGVNISRGAFWENSTIKSIDMSASPSLPYAAFYHASALENVILPNHITSIPDNVFTYTNLKSITIPENVTSIGSSTFAQTKNLTSVVIPKNVVTIGREAFGGAWDNLQSIEFEEGSKLKTIGELAFLGAKATTINLPDTVETIGSWAFAGSQITNLFLPESVKTLGLYAFNGGSYAYGTKLQELYCPKTIETQCLKSLEAASLSQSLLNTYEAKGGVYALTDSSGNISYFDSLANLKSGTACTDQTTCQATFMAAEGNYCSSVEECTALITADQNGQILNANGKRYASLSDLYAGNALPTIEEFEQEDGSSKVYKDGVFIGYKNKRIYTVEEASQIAGDNNTIKIRYK